MAIDASSTTFQEFGPLLETMFLFLDRRIHLPFFNYVAHLLIDESLKDMEQRLDSQIYHCHMIGYFKPLKVTAILPMYICM